MALTREQRYKPYAEWTEEEVKKIKENAARSPWHTNFHVEPPYGLLNDPNGFSFFKGKWQLFYQYFPFGAAHGLKSWVQTESEDLVHFEETGTVLTPTTPLDSHGMYSGSAMQFGDKLFIFYTGNVRDENWLRQTYQNGVLLDSDGNWEKVPQTLIAQPDDVTAHFRDPQIFYFDGEYYALIGAQDKNEKGFIKLYKADNRDYKTWSFVADLDFDNDQTAYMMECPNLVFVDGQPVLLYCPQGLDKAVIDYHNIYPNMYKIAQSFEPQTGKLHNLSAIQNLDYGFEAYATQAFNAPDGRALTVSWLGLPDIDYPTDKYDYQGVLSLVKELKIKDGKLYQYPVEAISSLRKDEGHDVVDLPATDNVYELELTFAAHSQTEIILFADQKGRGLSIKVDSERGTVTIDRSQAGEQYALEYGQSRSCSVEPGLITASIFIDKSVFEIFINKGEKVFSGRIFPDNNQTGILAKSGKVSGKYYELDYGRKTN
ncbi:sucrose-6-phosphate hydrolase [Streptococcus chenjunshii]|uniref:Sucrose-6-phosphate hydrolase n=1 Tax=Streptococcus chenjunshii TaxID=2173853 RepID=A0A372KNI1_9STRE|nr:sucrose-6-phosphate hydrolase [Streptococcus chenjunshii]AXQ78003.1 sucrose-6-phosphate hydrolase [Streptococcus chenjunshii]RFU51752.1 sucrose-6-phosphate hydrolase [Streptococcus chenjunshii]RFU53842.1 sucrose-6-phosphate hydrolase [Streptococcus chenjunshii]